MDGSRKNIFPKIVLVSLCVRLGTASARVHFRCQNSNSEARWVFRLRSSVGLFFILLIGAILAFTVGAYAENIDWEKVDAAFGRKAALSGDVHRYGFSSQRSNRGARRRRREAWIGARRMGRLQTYG